MDVGQFIETKVITDGAKELFGEKVRYELLEKGIKCPRKNCKSKDGMKFVMIGGDGPAATEGRIVYDCEQLVEGNIRDGITRIIDKQEAVKGTFDSAKEDVSSGNGMAGCHDF